jgi:hypothetical protein
MWIVIQHQQIFRLQSFKQFCEDKISEVVLERGLPFNLNSFRANPFFVRKLTNGPSERKNSVYLTRPYWVLKIILATKMLLK